GDPPETEPEQSYSPAGGGESHSAGATGGGRGGTQESGETAVDCTGSGKIAKRSLRMMLGQ
ncbi:hypothetical protein GOODEAATRI_025095, partial [Goodea atripinnis]